MPANAWASTRGSNKCRQGRAEPLARPTAHAHGWVAPGSTRPPHASARLGDTDIIRMRQAGLEQASLQYDDASLERDDRVGRAARIGR